MRNKEYRPAFALLRSNLCAKTLSEGTFTRWGSKNSSSPLFPAPNADRAPIHNVIPFCPDCGGTLVCRTECKGGKAIKTQANFRKEPVGTARREINESLECLRGIARAVGDRATRIITEAEVVDVFNHLHIIDTFNNKPNEERR